MADDTSQRTIAGQESGDSGRSNGLSVLLRGGAWNSLGQLSPLVVNLVLSPYVIHGLGKDRYGLFMLISTIGAFMGSFDGGLAPSAGRYFALYAGKDDRAATTRLLTTLVGLVAALGSVTFSLVFFGSDRLLTFFTIPDELRSDGLFMLRATAVIVVLGLLRSLFFAVLAAHRRFAYTNMIVLSLHAVYVVAAVISIRYGYGLRGITIGLMAQAALATLLVVPAALRHLSRSGIGLLPRSEVSEFLKFAGNVQVIGVVSMVNQQADSLITGRLLPVRFVGFLSAGASFATQLRAVPLNGLVPLASIVTREIGAVGEAAARPLFERLQRVWVIAGTGWSTVGAAAAYFGVQAWLGPDYAISGTVAAIVVFGNMFDLWCRAAAMWCTAIGRPQLNARYSVVGVVLNLVLTLALVRPFGILGVVAATSLSQALASAYLTRLCHRRLEHPIRSFVRDVPVLPAVLGALVALGTELAARDLVPRGPLGLLLCGLLGAPGLAVFAVTAFGPARVREGLGAVRSRLRARSAG